MSIIHSNRKYSYISILTLALGYGAMSAKPSIKCTPVSCENLLHLKSSVSSGSDGVPVISLRVQLDDEFYGKLWLNDTGENTFSSPFTVTLTDTTVILTPVMEKDRRTCRLESGIPLRQEDVVSINLPARAFEISPDYVEVDSIDIDDNLLSGFSIAGAWHAPGKPWTGPGMFSIIDDDSLDGQIKSSSEYGSYGYFSLLYPVLESLGLRGNIAGEGRRMGISDDSPQPNDNFRTLVRLQNEKGWEVLSHSMICIGEILNNWCVDSLTSPLADELLLTGPNNGADASTISVYDLKTKKQYWPNPDNTAWVETPSKFIKPYIGDYATKSVTLYNPDYDFDWHWGEWKRAATEFGLKPTGFVTHNTTSSHYLVPGIMQYFPEGFSDLSTLNINMPPILSSAVRSGLEGQSIKGYDGNDKDNTFNEDHFKIFCSQIDMAAENGGWIAFNLHAYRPNWRNSLPGALRSEGGDYPDEWVIPMKGVDSANDPYSPPARLGIKDWSEWYPCPGTRLRMLWETLKYAKEKGLINVTSSEGFAVMGNKKAYGYFSNGHKVGKDGIKTVGIRDKYPHYIVGATDETYYYNPVFSEEISFDSNGNVSVGQIEGDAEGELKISGKDIYWLSSETAAVELHVIDMAGHPILHSSTSHICLADMDHGAYIVCVIKEGKIIKTLKIML